MSSSNQMFSSDQVSEAIEKCRREKVVKKIRKRKENGWDEVHREMRIVVPEMIEKLEAREYIQKNLDDLFCDEIVKPSIELIANHHYKNIVAKNVWDMGWGDVHEELQELPFCEKQGQITKVFKCKCYGHRFCEPNGICVLCYEKNGKEFHRLAYKKGMSLLNDNSFKLFVHKREFEIPPMSQDIQIAYAGWPYCIKKKKLTKVMVCFENDMCICSEGCCFSCFKEDGVFHRLINLRGRENFVNGRDLKDKSFTEVCPCEGDIYFYYSKKNDILRQSYRNREAENQIDNLAREYLALMNQYDHVL